MPRKFLISFIVIISAFFVLYTHAQDTTSQDTHPRLFFDQQDLTRLRAQAKTTHREIWLPIRKFVDQKVPLLVPASAPISNDLDTYRNYGDAMIPLAFVCLIDQQPEDCEIARRYLLTITQWDRWDRGSERDLGFGHILFGSAIAFDWLYDEFTVEERSELVHRISQRAQEMYDASTQAYNATWNNWWTSSFVQNHYWVNNAALGMAGLALRGEIDDQACNIVAMQPVNLRAAPTTSAAIVRTGEANETFSAIGQQTDNDGFTWWHLEDELWVRADVVSEHGDCQSTTALHPQQWVEQATSVYERVNIFLEGIGDGTWHEGIFYQDYGLTMSIPFLFNLRRLSGTDLFPHTYLKNYTQWRLYNLLPGTAQYLMAYGDLEWWWEDVRAISILRFIAAEYDDSTAEWVTQQLLKHDEREADIWKAPWYVFEFLYYDPTTLASAPSDNQPLARTFSDLEGVIWRTGWGDNSLIFGLKTGPYGGRFSYETFVQQRAPWDVPCSTTYCALNAGHDHDDANSFSLFAGGQWLVPEVQGENNRATAFHNAILIDGQGQQRPRDETPESFMGMEGALERVVNTSYFNYLAADATPLYGNISDLIANRRYVAFVRPDYFLMVDHMAAQQPHQYEWLIHFGDHAILQDDWLRGESGTQVLGVQVVSPTPFASSLGNDSRPFVRIEPMHLTRSVNFIHLLVPTTSSEWNTRPTAELLEDTGEALLVRITHHNMNKRNDDALFVYTMDGQQWAGRIGMYYFDGRFAFVQRGDAGKIEKLFLVGGTMLSTFGESAGAGQILVANVDPSAQFEAVFNDIHIAVSTTSKRSVTLYAPLAEQVSVNGIPVPFEREGEFVVIPGLQGD